MKTFLDCIPCIVRQTLDSVRLIASDEAFHERVLREVLQASAEMDKDIYFLLKAKCPVIARAFGCQMDSLVLRRSILSAVSVSKG